jgi:Fe2+ transport system protein FeoA
MRLIGLAVVLTVNLALAPLAVEAQQSGKMPRIGFLRPGEAVHPAFRERLRELGYLEGQNITVEERHGGGGPEKAPELAAELVGLKVDVIVVRVSRSLAQSSKRRPPSPSCRSVRILWGPD